MAINKQTGETSARKLYDKSMLQTHAALADEILQYQRLAGGHLFLRGSRGRSADQRTLAVRHRIEELISSGSYRLVHRPCLCGADDDELIAVRDMYGFHLRTVICRHCGLVRLDPYFDDASLRDFYAREFDQLFRNDFMQNPRRFFAFNLHVKRSSVFGQLEKLIPDLPSKTVYEIGCGGGVEPYALS